MKLALILLLLQSPADIFKAANADMDAARWADAATKFEQILKDDPSHIPSEFDLAVCRARLGDLARSEQLYRAILEQDATIYEARINLGILLFNAGKDEAIEQFTQASTLRPKDSSPILYLARFFEKRGNTVGAAENYEHAIQLSPNDAAARLAAGLFYLRTQQVDKASDHLTAAERLGPGSPQLFIGLSEIEHVRNNEDKSILYLEKTLALDPSTNVRHQLAIAYFEQKNFEKAAAQLELLSAEDPANTGYLDMLGKSQEELKQFAKAAITLQRVLKIDPNDIDALNSLGTTFYFLEDWAHAIPPLERLIQLKPQDPLGYFFAAVCYDKLGNVSKALLNYNKFIELDDGSNDPRSFQVRQRAKALAQRKPEVRRR